MSKIPSDDVLESLYKLRIRESAQLKTVLELYDMEIHQKISMRNCQKLKTMVKRSIDQKLRLRNFDARHGRIGTGAVVKNRKGLTGVEWWKGICYQWKEKGQCSMGDQCSLRHESNDRAQKLTPKAATLSEPSMTKVTLMWFFDNRVDIIWKVLARDRFVSIGIVPNVWFCKTGSGCKAGDKCLFPHHKIDEQSNKKQKKSYPSRKGRESDHKDVVAVVKIVPQLGCVCGFSIEVDSPPETRCKTSWDQFEEYDSPSLRCVKQVSGKTKGPSLGTTTSQNSSSAKSLRYEIWWQISRRDCKTTAMRPKQGMESC